MQGIARIDEIKKAHNINWPLVELGFVAMQSNIHELNKFILMVKQVSAHRIYVSYAVAHCEEMIRESLSFTQGESDKCMLMARELAGNEGVFIDLPRLFSKKLTSGRGAVAQEKSTCLEPWTNLFLHANGEVGMCCGGGGSTGNLLDMNFEEMWNHKNRVAVRKLVNTKNPPAACRTCATIKQNPNNFTSFFPVPIFGKKSDLCCYSVQKVFSFLAPSNRFFFKFITGCSSARCIL